MKDTPFLYASVLKNTPPSVPIRVNPWLKTVASASKGLSKTLCVSIFIYGRTPRISFPPSEFIYNATLVFVFDSSDRIRYNLMPN